MEKQKIKYVIALILMFMLFVASSNSINAGEVNGNFLTDYEMITWGQSSVGGFTVELSIDNYNIRQRAFCMEHSKTTPLRSFEYTAKSYYPGDPDYNKRIATLLYYGSNGPADCVGDDNLGIVATSRALDYIYRDAQPGSGAFASTDEFQRLWAHVEAQDAPDNLVYAVLDSHRETYQKLAVLLGEDIPSTYKIKIHKNIQSPNEYYGNATPRGAEYGVYSNPECTNEVASLTIGDNGDSNVTGDLEQANYWVKEKWSSDTTVVDETVYFVDGNAVTDDGANGERGITINVSDWIRVGNLKVEKKDEHGNNIDNVTFRVTGPGGFDNTITTSGGVAYEFVNVPIGTYEVTEVNVPSGLYNSPDDRTRTITVEWNQTATFTRTNPYQRGKVTLVKYDADSENPRGDVKLSGAEFEFGAAEDIYEGNTLIYNAGKIETVITDEEGKTKTFENLPIGKYYYKETKAAEGCVLNEIVKNVEIRAQGQDEATAVTYVDDDRTEDAVFEQREIAYCPENEITITLEILKQIDETDYDTAKPLIGVQFKLTLNSDPSQVYYTHGTDGGRVSTNDGICKLENIPYGVYTVHEEIYPDEVLPAGDFEANFTKETNAFKGKVYNKDENEVFFVHNTPKTIQIDLTKKYYPDYLNKTDAKLVGAEFSVFTDAACTKAYKDKNGNPVKLVTQAVEGNPNIASVKSGEMLVQDYYLKETKFPEGMDGTLVNPDAERYGNPAGTTYADMVYKIAVDANEQHVKNVVKPLQVNNEPIKVKLEITKQIDETDYDPAELLKDVQFKLTLNSNPEVVYYTHGSNGGELSTADGLCILEDIPYGVYTVHEEKFPPSAIPCADFEANFTKETNAFKGKIYNKDEDEKYFVHNKPKTMQIEVNKMIENEFVNKTDAEVSGAVFTVYTDAECTQEYKDKLGNVVTIGPTNDDGYAISGKMRTQNYWLKETTFPEHMDENIVNPNAKKFNNPEGTTYKDMIYAVEQSNEDQPIEVDNVINTQNIENKPDSSRVIIVKYDDKGVMSEDSLPLGATVRLVLDSHPEVYYDVVVNEYGYLDFENKEVKEKYYGGKPVDESFTIPYGVYTLKEISESDDGNNKDWYFQNIKVYVTGENDVKPFILADYDVEFMLDIVKIDTDTGAKVGLPNAGYMVYSKEKEDFVELKVHDGTDNPPINVFYTNNQGNLKLPEKIPAGEYVLYEVKAPKGYYLEDGLRLPYKDNSNPIVINEEDNVTYISKDDAKIDQSKLGKTDFGGKLIPSTKENLNLPKDGEYPTNPVEAFKYALENLTYTVEASDRPDKFQIELYKTGDMFSGVKEETYNENGIVETVKIPQYTKEGLNGVTFKITAVEDILSEDGTQVYRNAGWSTTMTTGENGQPDGYAVSEKLYNGKYRVEEIVTPVGYKKCDSFEVDEHNYDQYNDVLQVSKEADNEYQPVTINFSKLFENQLDTNNPIYLVEGETLEEKTKENYAVFGLYNKNDLNSAKNNKTIKADSLMYVASVKSGEEGKISSLLPDGEYYLKELYVNSPYSMVDDQFVININHRAVNNEASVLKVEGPEIENYVEGGDFALVKTSVLDALNYFDLPAMTKEVDIERLEPLLLDYSERTTDSINDGEATIESVINDLKARGVRAIGSAEYELYADENMTKHVIVSKDGGQTFENVTITSEGSEYDSLGVYLIKGLPNGAYYLKETKAPKYMDNSGNVFEYDLYDGAIPFTIGNDKYDGEEIKFRIVSDTMPTISISKTDIFTSEPIENCLFTITDENGKELIRFVTNEHGKAEIPTEIFEDGKKYYFTELDAPKYPYYDGDDLYELNKEPHEFIAHIDEEGKWKFKEIDEEGNETIIEKIEIVNYRVSTDVELLKLDMVDSTAIPNCKFVLESKETGFREEGITDENGIYVFKNVPYGKYTYTELEAPEGWMIDTTPHEFTLDSHGTKIVVYDERKVELPDTGDVNVIVLSAIGVMSLITISVILKKKYIISK